jgi:glycerol-3-phosphate acyltransferase PlsX
VNLPVAVDAMGGDRAPSSIVEGALLAAHEHGVPVVLVGRADDLPDVGGLPVVNASEVIDMGDDPAQGVRRKKDASVVRAAEMVRDGTARAMVSAGNTGAAMVAALLRMGRIKGVSRPAIATTLPIPGMVWTTPTVLLDSGANAECQPEWLVQFAVMGGTYFRHRYGAAHPRVGLLSIGEESVKGNTLVKAAHELLAAEPAVNFIGNVEGRDMLTDDIDVVVTDGFTGNVVLKTLEGCGTAISRAFVHAFASTDVYREASGVLSPVLDPLLVSIDYETYGGAMLLGVDGVCIIAHGSSQARAVSNAIVLAQEMADEAVVGQLRSAVTPS